MSLRNCPEFPGAGDVVNNKTKVVVVLHLSGKRSPVWLSQLDLMTVRDLKRANLTIISPKILVENKLSVALLLCFPYPRISKSKDLNSREENFKNRQAIQIGTGARAFTSASSYVGECICPWKGKGNSHISRILDTQHNFLL